ncbi:uncharacterized protein BDZ99DRAFT_481375 [Mytilinidion resinicola]|uniref:Uncharacterized protein n=1 Tax=Mytilinidion resinicola TaxID=574789 RepID=A0A6A6Y6Q5_9PEZI|nr:uncharacterized protein BDZ99DRAFT_481375 [Mytilinidion resinicola]KAF2804208.1 hypothetical protein BDZ99DRAFT_481375 [Mytilinidion resinicola]
MATRGGKKGKGKKAAAEPAPREIPQAVKDFRELVAQYVARYSDSRAALQACKEETPAELRETWNEVVDLDKELEGLEEDVEKMEDLREDLLRWVEGKAEEDYMVPKEDGTPNLRVVKASPYEEHAETVVSFAVSFSGRRYAEHVLADAAEEEKRGMRPVFSENGALARPLWQYRAGEHPRDAKWLHRPRASTNRR